MSGLGSPEFWAFLILLLWGCYHRAQHLKYKNGQSTPSTQTKGEGYRVHYREGRKSLTLDVPAAKTEEDALRYTFSKLRLNPDKIDRVEKL